MFFILLHWAPWCQAGYPGKGHILCFQLAASSWQPPWLPCLSLTFVSFLEVLMWARLKQIFIIFFSFFLDYTGVSVFSTKT